MKKILNALFLTLLAVFTFSSCSDVPAPYDILGEGDVPVLQNIHTTNIFQTFIFGKEIQDA